MESFTVIRDGEVDKSYERKQRTIKFGNALMGYATAAYEAVERTLATAALDVQLYNYDQAHGTELRSEWLEQRAEAQEQELRGQFVLQ
jgi:hypothetical protein